MARSSKMVVAKSTRGTSRTNGRGTSKANQPTWNLRTYVRLFGIVSGIGAILVTYDTVSNLFGRETVNLAISASVLIAIALWLRSKVRASLETSPEKNLETLEREALLIATSKYQPVNARNTAMRTAREIIILRAALDNSSAKK